MFTLLVRYSKSFKVMRIFRIVKNTAFVVLRDLNFMFLRIQFDFY